MAIPFLSRVVVQQITQRVLSNVLEQLPSRMSRNPSIRDPIAVDELSTANAFALSELESHVQSLAAAHETMGARVTEIERRVGWRSYAKIITTSLLTYVLGFATAVILGALGWIG